MTARDLFEESPSRAGERVIAQTCGTCGHGALQPNGFIRCAVGPKWSAYTPGAPCQQRPVQWIERKQKSSASPRVSGNGVSTEPDARSPCQGQSGAGTPGRAERFPGPHSTRDASMAAIHAMRADGRITERQKELLEFFAGNPGQDFTRQEIARRMTQQHGPKWGIPGVCGRVNELMKTGQLREIGAHRICRVTGETVNAIERGDW